jgi:hypothetical protein
MVTLEIHDVILILFHGRHKALNLAEEIDFTTNTFTMPFYRLN